ncbi:MAG: ankyrin repeat domain-containing protein [Candidatus Margulisbacteria bacterium]|nr:ankyrin repeat domain-containing protein [Candidatus Margulisiibacteriota bacterium]
MKRKIISIGTKKRLTDSILLRLKLLEDKRLNVFFTFTAESLIDNLLEAKIKGIDLRELVSGIKGLEFLAMQEPPVVQEKDPAAKAKKSIYICLDQLNSANKSKVLQNLARDFRVLKYLNIKEDGYLARELFEAIEQKNTVKAKKLIRMGADFLCTRVETKYGPKDNIFLIQACWECVNVVKELILVGADLEAVNNDNNTALMRTAGLWGGEDVLDLLIAKGADVNYINTQRNNYSVLMQAVLGKHVRNVQKLLKSGADVNHKDITNTTSLMFAAQIGKKELFEVLLKGGADINARNNGGWTALMFAAVNGHKDIVEMLLKKKADKNIKDADNWTALTLALSKEHKEVAGKLIISGAELNIQSGEEYQSALSMAIIKNYYDLVKEILRRKADINIRCRSDFRHQLTPLILAIVCYKQDMARLIISKKPDLNLQDYEGLTALMSDLKYNRGQLFSLILKAGADVNVKDNWNRTALFYAIKTNNKKAVRSLVAKGAEINITDNKGTTPLQLAIMEKRTEIIDILKGAGAVES